MNRNRTSEQIKVCDAMIGVKGWILACSRSYYSLTLMQYQRPEQPVHPNISTHKQSVIICYHTQTPMFPPSPSFHKNNISMLFWWMPHFICISHRIPVVSYDLICDLIAIPIHNLHTIHLSFCINILLYHRCSLQGNISMYLVFHPGCSSI